MRGNFSKMIKFIFALTILVAVSSAEDCDIACQKIYEPVCGSDGVTYSNLCQLRATNCLTKSFVEVMFEGHCSNPEELVQEECDLACQLNYDPVCGSDGSTYNNMCALKAANCLSKNSISLTHEGECLNVAEKDEADEECSFKCFHNYEPVCGSDGVTYRNPCALETTNCMYKTEVLIASEGKCNEEPYQAGRVIPELFNEEVGECETICHFDYEPVCGTDRKTHNNLCHLKAASCLNKNQIELLHYGECHGQVEDVEHDEDECNLPCQMIFDPICASNGETFSNLCELKSYNCLTKSAVQVLREGEC